MNAQKGWGNYKISGKTYWIEGNQYSSLKRRV